MSWALILARPESVESTTKGDRPASLLAWLISFAICCSFAVRGTPAASAGAGKAAPVEAVRNMATKNRMIYNLLERTLIIISPFFYASWSWLAGSAKEDPTRFFGSGTAKTGFTP
jgi:hypothetical protein